MATLVRLSSQDRKELDKYTKFFAQKTVQVIVQARLGEKFKTRSKKFSSGSDWFSVNIEDLPEVNAETKNALGGQLPSTKVTLCVEISLKTVEGETMVLETWSLGMIDQCDTDVRITYTVYNRMGVLLKSLIVTARATHAYRLSRSQGPDSYVICYRVHLGEPNLHVLGEGYLQRKVGQVGTPIGTFLLNVAYRTKLTITPQPVEKESSIMVKSDHFKPDLSPKRAHRPVPRSDFREGLTDETGAMWDGHLNHACLCDQEFKGIPCRAAFYDRSPKWDLDGDLRFNHNGDRPMSFSEYKKVGAFAGEPKKLDTDALSEYLIPDTAFTSLLDNNALHNKNMQQKKLANNNNTTNGLDHSDMDTCSETGSHESQISTASIASAITDDFVMVELKTPFATPDPNNDLSNFYRECQIAPQLDSFRNSPTLADQVNDLSNQLATFEMNMQDFDQLVDSLCNSETWK
uniref:Autophagy-related protein 13 n=1 Tax=Strigamia maritima TaxID=126957 RepID=T1IPJ1_STRMM